MFRFMNKFKNRKGFTLVELIVVLAVLAIIGIIAVPKFLGIQEQARVDADNATIEMVQSALEIWVAAEDVALPATGAKTTLGVLDTTKFKLDDGITGDDATNLTKYLDAGNAKLQVSGKSVTFKIDENSNIEAK